jgi:hypothetical protein
MIGFHPDAVAEIERARDWSVNGVLVDTGLPAPRPYLLRHHLVIGSDCC